MKVDKGTSNAVQNTSQKTNDRAPQHEPHYKARVNTGASHYPVQISVLTLPYNSYIKHISRYPHNLDLSKHVFF
jgi:hypothetical protein